MLAIPETGLIGEPRGVADFDQEAVPTFLYYKCKGRLLLFT